MMLAQNKVVIKVVRSDRILEIFEGRVIRIQRWWIRGVKERVKDDSNDYALNN